MAVKFPKTYPGTVSIRFMSDINSIHLAWSSFMDSPTVRQAITEGVDYCKEHGVLGWIADTRHCTTAMMTADQDWIEKEAIPRALQSGVRMILSVLPEQMAVRVANEAWEQQVAKSGFIQQNFASLEDTVAFIKQNLPALSKK